MAATIDIGAVNVGDYVVVYSKWECCFAKGHVISNGRKYLIIKCNSGRIEKFSKQQELSIARAEKFPKKLKTKKVFELYSDGGCCLLEASSIKKCIAYLKEMFDNSSEISAEDFISSFYIEVKYKLAM